MFKKNNSTNHSHEICSKLELSKHQNQGESETFSDTRKIKSLDFQWIIRKTVNV